MAVDKEKIASLQILDQLLRVVPLAARVLTLPAEIHAENGIAKPLEVLGKPLPLEVENSIFKVLARSAYLVDEHHHGGGGAKL